MRDSFVFYKSYYEAIQELEPDVKLRLLDAICEYAYNDVLPDLNGAEMAIFRLIRPQIDANNRKYESGKKGGAPEGNKNAKKVEENKQKTTKNNQKQPNSTKNNQIQPNVNVNVNDNVNEDVNVSAIECADESGKPDYPTYTSLIIAKLNDRTGRRFQSDTDSNQQLVKGLLDRGYTLEQIMRVIDRKCDEWLPLDNMRPYLRPSTLLRPEKFDEYLNAPPTQEERLTAERNEKRKQALVDIQALEQELARINEKYDAETDRKKRVDLRFDRELVQVQLEAARAAAGVSVT